MNRAQRRQQQRAEKKAQQKGGTYNIDMEMIQPWSDVLMKINPDECLMDVGYYGQVSRPREKIMDPGQILMNH